MIFSLHWDVKKYTKYCLDENVQIQNGFCNDMVLRDSPPDIFFFLHFVIIYLLSCGFFLLLKNTDDILEECC